MNRPSDLEIDVSENEIDTLYRAMQVSDSILFPQRVVYDMIRSNVIMHRSSAIEWMKRVRLLSF
jgi:hypothetical protein